ncbi:MAG: alpha/beta hydrolase [Acidobacteria bacterium]|nr:alpha/beta hydrolase [Acidobacteriota bacterium]
MGGDPVILDGASAFTLTSSAGRAFRVFLSVPATPPPSTGFPMLMVLDAERIFATAVESIRARARRPDATGVGPAVVVGVMALPLEPGKPVSRTFDFTPAPAADGSPQEIGSSDAAGGAPALLRFLEDDLAPWVETMAPIDPAYRVLFGHSLAGYFALWALLNGATFTSYIAVSPSIWWGRAAIEPRPGTIASNRPRLMITVGEFEQRRAPWQPDGLFTEDALRRRTDRRMVDNAGEVASALAPVATGGVDFHVFPGEDHASVAMLSLARALRFALPPAAATWPFPEVVTSR